MAPTLVTRMAGGFWREEATALTCGFHGGTLGFVATIQDWVGIAMRLRRNTDDPHPTNRHVAAVPHGAKTWLMIARILRRDLFPKRHGNNPLFPAQKAVLANFGVELMVNKWK